MNLWPSLQECGWSYVWSNVRDGQNLPGAIGHWNMHAFNMYKYAKGKGRNCSSGAYHCRHCVSSQRLILAVRIGSESTWLQEYFGLTRRSTCRPRWMDVCWRRFWAWHRSCSLYSCELRRLLRYRCGRLPSTYAPSSRGAWPGDALA